VSNHRASPWTISLDLVTIGFFNRLLGMKEAAGAFPILIDLMRLRGGLIHLIDSAGNSSRCAAW
jgi:hypothetical protein